MFLLVLLLVFVFLGGAVAGYLWGELVLSYFVDLIGGGGDQPPLGPELTETEAKDMRLFVPLYTSPTSFSVITDPAVDDFQITGTFMKKLDGRVDVVVKLIDQAATDSTNAAGLNHMKSGAGDKWHKIHGYVNTLSSFRDMNLVKAEITTYFTKWGEWVGNIYLDDVKETQDAETSNVEYYKEIANFVASLSSTARIILNPRGTPISNALMSLPGVEAAVWFESAYPSYASWSRPPADKTKNVAIVNFFTEEFGTVKSMLRDMYDKGYSRVYLNHVDTSDVLLSDYMLDMVQALQLATTPAPAPIVASRALFPFSFMNIFR